MAGTERIDVNEFRKRIASGGIQLGKKGKVISMDSPAPKAPKKAKFGNIKVCDPLGGKPFDSKLEAKHGAQYRAMARAGEILTVARQPVFTLASGITYIADFMIMHLGGSIEIVDSKGVQTPEFKLKEKLFRAKYPDLKFTVRTK